MTIDSLNKTCCAVGVLAIVNLAAQLAAQTPVSSGTIITIAGNGTLGFAGDGGQATDASLNRPQATTVGPDGTLYIVDSQNYRIRAVDPTSGIISTIAGNGSPIVEDGPNGDGGPATSAQLDDAVSLSVDRENNTLYLPGFSLGRVRQVNLATGIISNFAGIGMNDIYPGQRDGDDGPATAAYFFALVGMDVGPDGDVFTTDDNYRLRRVDSSTGIIHRMFGIEHPVFGDPIIAKSGDGGPASEASGLPHNLRVDRDGNVFMLDTADPHTVRRIDADTGIITRIAGGGANPATGGGQATDVNFADGLWDISLDNAGNLFIAESRQIFKLTLATGELSTYAGTGVGGFAGDGGPASDAQFSIIAGLEAVPGGGLLVADYDNQRVRYVAPDSINLVGDAGLTEFHLPWVTSLTGNVTISDNPNVTAISTGGLISVTGVVEITGNSATGVVDLGSLETVGGAVSVTSNQATGVVELGTGVVDLGALETVGGPVSVTGNQATGVVDLGALQSVTGNVTITDNGNATVSVGSLENVTGNVTLESTGMGTFSTGSANVTGNVNLNLDGYTTVAASTGGGETGVTMINNEATMEVTLPDGAFTSDTPVAFSVTQVPGGVETVDGNTVTHLDRYVFDFAIPTLNSPAELNFQIDLTAMDEPQRLDLLELIQDDALLTIGVLGDAPDAELQLFDVCAPATNPLVDECVVVRWLDANGSELDPAGGVDPAVLRFEALVGHFSTYSVIALSSTPTPGDIDQDGDVDRDDAALFSQFFGRDAGSTWETGDFNGDNATTLDDWALLQSHLGQPAPNPIASSAAVPAPVTVWLAIVAILAVLRRVRRQQNLCGRRILSPTVQLSR